MSEPRNLTPAIARRVVRLDDLRIVIDPPSFGYWYTPERREQALRAWAREIEDFLRDHRSQDPVRISVERVETTVCDQCGAAWELATDDSGPFCANCGIPAIKREDDPA